MGVSWKEVDAILLLFLVISAVAPLLNVHTCLPESICPEVLVRLNKWYATAYQDYLVVEKPHFFVALIWFDLVVQWPLALLNLYGMLSSKPWFNTSCLIHGTSVVTSMVAMLGEIVGSQKASNKLLMMYSPFMGFGVLAMLRGLLHQSANAKPSALTREKGA